MRYFKLVVLVFVGGCGIGGYWMNGNPFSDKSAARFVDLWGKVGATSEERMKDWLSCGCRINGGVGFDTAGKIFPGESDQSAYERLERGFYSCLIKKGYRYSGCTKEFYKEKPICRG